MVYRGIVRNGKIELENGGTLPEGTLVHVEPVDDSVKEWKVLAQEVSNAWKSPRSAVELLIDSRE